MSALILQRVHPQAGVRGGQVQAYCTGLDAQALAQCQVVFGATPTRAALLTPTFLLGTIPERATPHQMHLLQGDAQSNTVAFAVADLLAENLHPTGNPAVDSQGNIYTTSGGTTGQPTQVSIYKISPLGDVEPFASGITNPTGLAFGPDGDLYVSSRHDGTVYRIDTHGTVTPFASQLGVATGLAFDAQGHLFVGDSRGTIHQVASTGAAQTFVRLPQSVASYHLAFGPDGRLYVSYPTLSGYDQVVRITPEGEVESFAEGLGRAQGLAFDREHNAYVVAYAEGRGGVVRITPTGTLTHVIAGVNLVGLAFAQGGELILADTSAVYKLAFGVPGRPLP